MNFIWGICVSLALVCVGVLPAHARCEDHVPQPKPQNASRDYVGADLDTIYDRGFMEFAFYQDFPPRSYVD